MCFILLKMVIHGFVFIVFFFPNLEQTKNSEVPDMSFGVRELTHCVPKCPLCPPPPPYCVPGIAIAKIDLINLAGVQWEFMEILDILKDALIYKYLQRICFSYPKQMGLLPLRIRQIAPLLVIVLSTLLSYCIKCTR